MLVDELKLATQKWAALDLFQFVFGLTYMFAFSIPFPLGGTAQPGMHIHKQKHFVSVCVCMCI